MRDNGEGNHRAEGAPQTAARRTWRRRAAFWVLLFFSAAAAALALGLLAHAVLRYLESAAVGGVLRRVL